MKKFTEKFKGLAKIKQKGDEFVAKAILIMIVIVIGGIMIAVLKPQFTSFMNSAGTKMNSFLEQ